MNKCPHCSKVIKHLKGDIKDFGREAGEDRELIKDLEGKAKPQKGARKFKRVLREFKEKKLHQGSKRGPKVKKLDQALAIAFNEKRKDKKKRK